MRQASTLRVAILGHGRVGKALARSLRRVGAEVRYLRRAGGGGPRVDLLALAVPDRAIAREATRLAAAGASFRFAIHLAGAYPATLLKPLARGGARIASFHPLRSFAGGKRESLHGCAVAIEGDPAAVRFVTTLARAMGASPWKIAPRDKPLYHAAATLAAGGTATVTAAAVRLATRVGMSPELALLAFTNLAASAIGNFRYRGFTGGLTGPWARGDRETARLHRQTLGKSQKELILYKSLETLTVDLSSIDRRRRRH